VLGNKGGQLFNDCDHFKAKVIDTNCVCVVVGDSNKLDYFQSRNKVT